VRIRLVQAFLDVAIAALKSARLDQRVTDGVIRRMIDKWLKAGVLEEGLCATRPKAPCFRYAAEGCRTIDLELVARSKPSDAHIGGAPRINRRERREAVGCGYSLGASEAVTVP
jgi:hypothetical protein